MLMLKWLLNDKLHNMLAQVCSCSYKWQVSSDVQDAIYFIFGEIFLVFLKYAPKFFMWKMED